MKVLITSSELHPLVKVGGLGDVMGSLPKALKKKGINITIAIPYYKSIDKNKYKIKQIKKNIKCSIDGKLESFDIYKAFLPDSKVPILLISHKFFNDNEVYSSEKILKKYRKKYSVNIHTAERFVTFCKCLLHGIKELNLKPDIIHCNDWQTGIIPDLLNHFASEDVFYKGIKTLYTIHNLQHQGKTSKKILPFLELSKSLIRTKTLNLMKRGIEQADLVNTVSPNYKKEILTKKYGEGLDKVLKNRKENLSGIINGIDTTFFDPKKDKYIPVNYDVNSIEKKEENKKYLCKKLGLKYDKNILLFGIVSRLVEQKGLDIFIPAVIEAVKHSNFQLVVLGTGKKNYEKKIKNLAKKHPDNIKALIEFNVKLAQEIYCASDVFLMPSRFEPCGLGQLISLRYGTIPLVRNVGGLKDTVKNNINGFTFKKYNYKELSKIMLKSVDLFTKNKKKWKQMQKYGMMQDFSWGMSADEYIKLYKKIS